MATQFINLKSAQRLQALWMQVQTSIISYNSMRAVVLEMLGLDPEDQKYGFYFETGMIIGTEEPVAPLPVGSAVGDTSQ